MDPFSEVPTLVMICDAIDPITRQHYERDPRWIAKKAEMYLNNSGLADTAYFGAEGEFFIFDNISFDQTQHSGFYYIDAEEEAARNVALRKTKSDTAPRYKEGLLCRFSSTDSRISGSAHGDCRNHDPLRVGYRMPSITKWPPAGSARSTRSTTRC
jgi:hypothetical protein